MSSWVWIPLYTANFHWTPLESTGYHLGYRLSSNVGRFLLSDGPPRPGGPGRGGIGSDDFQIRFIFNILWEKYQNHHTKRDDAPRRESDGSAVGRAGPGSPDAHPGAGDGAPGPGREAAEARRGRDVRLTARTRARRTRPAPRSDPNPVGSKRGAAAGASRFRGANRRWGREPACKPGSVEGSHSSRTRVAARLQRPTRERRGPRLSLPYSVLLRAGFTLPPVSPPARCALTAPFHPYPRMAGGMFSVALSVGSRPPGVTWRPALRSPDFPPRRETRRSGCPADSRRPSFRLSGALRKRENCPTLSEHEREG